MENKIYDAVVLGAGESGVGAALLYKAKGISVFVSDYGSISSKYKKELEDNNIDFEECRHSQEIILKAHEVVKSPGIPDSAPIIQLISKNNIPIISEIELAGRYIKGKVIGITGSNGKTTTTMWIQHILSTAGIRSSLAGNVGFSLARQVITEDQPDWFVVELSSFQLDNMYRFRVNIAVLMNITPDHLDRYDHNFDNYANSKMRILQNQTNEDAFVYWAEDEWIAKYIYSHTPMPMKLLPFHTYPQVGAAADKSDENMLRIHFDDNNFEIPINELSLSGPHNLQNAMAASIVAMQVGIDKNSLKKALSDFINVPHRLELIDVIDGVRYINDSKATNINSTYYALRTMTTPYVLIIGGTDKGNNYDEISNIICKDARGLVFLAKDRTKLHKTFDGRIKNIADAESMEQAIRISTEMAEEGDTVLLSPACASFDLFKNYEDRGNKFREEVKRLRKNK